MDYKGKKVAITGATGFIGRHLSRALFDAGANIVTLSGDTRRERTFDAIDHTFDYLFHFAAPSSQVLFKRKPMYCAEVTIKGFINASFTAANAGVKLIYPSTGLLSHGKDNEYARCKKVCEDIHLNDKGYEALGIRIFGTYGPGEDYKRDYASPPFLFARDYVDGKTPVVFGDGEQSRDFIFIEDTVAGIMVLADECSDPIADLGSGKATTFNRLIGILGEQGAGEVKPEYVDKPVGYIKETLAKPNGYYEPAVPIEEGMKRTIEHLKNR